MTFCYLLRWIWEFHFQNGLLQNCSICNSLCGERPPYIGRVKRVSLREVQCGVQPQRGDHGRKLQSHKRWKFILLALLYHYTEWVSITYMSRIWVTSLPSSSTGEVERAKYVSACENCHTREKRDALHLPCGW